MIFPPRRRDLFAGAAGLLALYASGTRHGLASETQPARMRLLAGGRDGDGRILAGVHLSLSPGWKTYWRLPGGSGIPPVFDWSGSTNVQSVVVLYPAPRLLGEGKGMFLGYTGETIFPVQVIAKDPAADSELILNMAYGVCERICIPSESQARLRLPRHLQSDAGNLLIERALARVPRRVPAGTMVRDWRYVAPERRIEFAVDALGGVEFATVEGNGNIDLEIALPVVTTDSMKRFSVGCDVPAGTARNAPLLVTIVSRRSAVEEEHTLDG